MPKEHPLSTDEKYMALACRLARRGEGKTSPNPMVGAVLIKAGKVIGMGYHKKPGAPHAEIAAFRNADTLLKGATLYVNLEPCAHYGKTPPCVDSIIAEKIKRVVIGAKDPNPLVKGKSIRLLKKQGVEVTCGILEEKCRRLNEAFYKSMETGKPLVTLKAATSLDGKIACYTGRSQWISCSVSRKKGHRYRSRVDAILVGIGTVLKDDPQLTVRGIAGARNPLRVIMDSRLRIPLTARILRPEAPTLLVTTPAAPQKKIDRLAQMGVAVKIFKPNQKGRIPFTPLLRHLGKSETQHLLIEGGAGIYLSAFEEGIVDKCLFFIAPLLLGGQSAPMLLGGQGVKTPQQGYTFSDFNVSKSGRDMVLEGYLKDKGKGV